LKVAFLDRDGTIIKDYPDKEWSEISSPEFLNGAIKALQRITELGYKIIIITNQYLIGEGYISEKDYYSFNEKFVNTINLSGVSILDTFHCPHARNSACDCCKPKTGLIKQSIAKYPRIDLTQSFYCGDSLCDMELAKNMNIRFFGINLNQDAVHSITSLYDILDLI